MHFENEFGSYDLQVPYTEIKLSDTPGVGPNAPFKDYNTEGPKCDPKEGLAPLRLDWILDRGDVEEYEGRRRNLEDDGKRAIKRGKASKEWRGRQHKPMKAKDHPVTQMWYARHNIITPEMRYGRSASIAAWNWYAANWPQGVRSCLAISTIPKLNP